MKRISAPFLPLLSGRRVRPVARSDRRALTLIELLVALLVGLVLIGSVVSVFIGIMRTTNQAAAEMESVSNARSALDTMSIEIKAASSPLTGLNNTGYSILVGDGYDNDQDGYVDEEMPDGRNDDNGPWTDQHATIEGSAERPDGATIVDLGDGGVDEDVVFNYDELSFRVSPVSGADYDVHYKVTNFEGHDRVLIRSVDGLSTSPLAYDVLSFNCLYWDPTAPTPTRRWSETWADPATLPASVAVFITTYADRRPIESYRPGDKVRVTTLPTIVDIESVIP